MIARIVLIIALIVGVALCMPQPQILYPRASSGCGKPAFLPGITQYRFFLKSSGKDRSYAFHLPASYDRNKAYPVVVGFHGSSSIGTFFELDTKMSEGRYSGDVSTFSYWNSSSRVLNT